MLHAHVVVAGGVVDLELVGAAPAAARRPVAAVAATRLLRKKISVTHPGWFGAEHIGVSALRIGRGRWPSTEAGVGPKVGFLRALFQTPSTPPRSVVAHVPLARGDSRHARMLVITRNTTHARLLLPSQWCLRVSDTPGCTLSHKRCKLRGTHVAPGGRRSSSVRKQRPSGPERSLGTRAVPRNRPEEPSRAVPSGPELPQSTPHTPDLRSLFVIAHALGALGVQLSTSHARPGS